jgi:hypothetical protein
MELSISLALFSLLVLLPGYINVTMGGREETANRKLQIVVIRGLIIFSLVIIFLLMVDRNTFGKLFRALSGDYTVINWLNILAWLTMFAVVAIVLGICQLWFDLRFVTGVKSSIAWRHFIMGNQVMETSPRENIFHEIFLCYRMVGKRPVVSVSVAGTYHKGEVLKVNWGIRPGLLINEMDNPEKITWISLQNIDLVKFENPGIIPECAMLDHKTREILNLIHPGYGDEVENKYRQRLD